MPAYVRRLAAVSALAVSCAVASIPAHAADLYEPPYEDRYSAVPDDFEPPYPPPAYARRGCIPREEARERLRDAGWRGFHDVEPHEDVVRVKARRPSGRLYDLTIDRCSGEVVDARPIYRGGPYAYGPRRYYGGGPRLGVYLGL